MKIMQQIPLEMRPDELRKYRRRKRESQGHFWSRFGVTQSRGSRFEKGAEIPRPVAILLELYFNGIVTDVDLAMGQGNLPHARDQEAPAALPGSDFPDMKARMANQGQHSRP